MTTRSEPTPTAYRHLPAPGNQHDRGVTFIELLVAVVLMGLCVVGVLAAVQATVVGTRVERDHSKAQQWLQSAIGVIEAQDFAGCDSGSINGASVEAAYQAAVDHPATGAKRPFGFSSATLDVKTPEVWDGTSFVPFDSQSVCYDDIRLRQQRITIEVAQPGGVRESVEMIKVDR